MSAEFKKVDNGIAELIFTVSSEEFDNNISILFNKNAKNFTVKGFRKGKAPLNRIRQCYKDDTFYLDVYEYFINKEYSEYLLDNDVTVLTDPKFDVINMKSKEDLIFKASFTNSIDFELGDYKTIKLIPNEVIVADEDIDNELENTRDKNARIIDVDDEPVELGNIVTIDFEGSIYGELFDGGKGTNQELTIGKNEFIPGFEEQLIGHNLNENFDINVVFPEDYHAEDMKGKNAIFNITINSIKTKILPDLDDELAKDVSEYETLDEYKEEIKGKLLKSKQEDERNRLQNELFEKIIEISTIEIPNDLLDFQNKVSLNDLKYRIKSMGVNIEQYLKMTGKTMDSFLEEIKPKSEEIIKTKLIMDKIFELENLELNNEDWEVKFKELGDANNIKPEEVKNRLISNGSLKEVVHNIKKSKILDLILK